MSQFLLKSPAYRAAANAVCSGGMTVLTGVTVNLLTADGNFHPKTALQTPSFWALVVFVIAWALLQRAQYVQDRETMRFSDNEFCSAYVRQHHLTALATKLQKDPASINVKDMKALCKGLGIDLGEAK
ncbi:hypothetical protein [Diaphorobacter sp.]|uniref:hypothetical protein n=1 Tax=Diaphorobacter sp. TaxID=1934310 RepID=UPI00258D222B|nr:hypothetical protein [Diaphorobacter sp.]